MDKSWKDYLLRSGLPLENDVKKYLESKGCVSSFEYSYLKPDEREIEKEFSYDIDAAYFKPSCYVEFMVECKYRHESTKWIFGPKEYGGVEEVHANSFMHPMDHFASVKFPFMNLFPEQLAPLCSKGTEITSSGDNEKTISQAISQLSYAFAQKIVSAITNQADFKSFRNCIFYQIPIIATTAKLYRLKDGVDIEQIKSARDIEEISEKYNCLVLKNSIGTHLEKYNRKIFDEFLTSVDKNKLKKKLESFTDDLDFLFSVLAANYCPAVIVIVHYSKENNGFDELFRYIDRLVRPPKDLIKKIKDQEKRLKIALKSLEERAKRNKSVKDDK